MVPVLPDHEQTRSPSPGVQVAPACAEAHSREGALGCLRSTRGTRMIIGTDDRKGIKWPLFAVLVVVCGLLIGGASFMQRSALTSKVKSQESKASVVVRQIVAPAVAKANLTKPLPSGTAAKLRNQLQ